MIVYEFGHPSTTLLVNHGKLTRICYRLFDDAIFKVLLIPPLQLKSFNTGRIVAELNLALCILVVVLRDILCLNCLNCTESKKCDQPRSIRIFHLN